MNRILWILQILLAMHTAVGTLWMLKNPEQTMPSLSAIPHAVWLSLSVIGFLCAIALIVPVLGNRRNILAPIAAAFVIAEMLFFSGVHLASGANSLGPVIYWLVVAAVASFIVYGRLMRKPVLQNEFA